MRIIFIPVDERVCTRDYFIQTAKAFNINIHTPSRKMLGQKKIPADTQNLLTWLDDTIKNNDILILSLDTLLYGGLIPSRIDLLKEEILLQRLEQLIAMARRAKKCYITTTIMRIPKYNSDDEEPVYWEYYGKRLHDMTKIMAGLLTEQVKTQMTFTETLYQGVLEEQSLQERLAVIPSWIIDDYFHRR